jgi:hypothetical protein
MDKMLDTGLNECGIRIAELKSKNKDPKYYDTYLGC